MDTGTLRHFVNAPLGMRTEHSSGIKAAAAHHYCHYNSEPWIGVMISFWGSSLLLFCLLQALSAVAQESARDTNKVCR